jgi:hypothetical protein
LLDRVKSTEQESLEHASKYTKRVRQLEDELSEAEADKRCLTDQLH